MGTPIGLFPATCSGDKDNVTRGAGLPIGVTATCFIEWRTNVVNGFNADVVVLRVTIASSTYTAYISFGFLILEASIKLDHERLLRGACWCTMRRGAVRFGAAIAPFPSALVESLGIVETA